MTPGTASPIRPRKVRRGQRGQSIAEFALLLPIVMVLFAGALDLGRLFYAQITVTNAAREGAMEAAANPGSFVAGSACNASTNRVTCQVVHEADGSFVSVAPSDISLTCSPSCTAAIGNTVTVSVQGHFTLLTPIMAIFTGGTNVTFNQAATAQIATAPTGGTLVDTDPTDSPTPTSTASPTAAPTASPTAAPTASPSPTPTPAPGPTPTPGPSASPTPTASAAPTPSPSPSPTPCAVPSAGFRVSPSTGVAYKNNGHPGTTFQFTDQSSGMDSWCNPIYSWNFGDGAGASSLQNPTYVYSSANTNPGFLVTLTVSTNGGSSTSTRLIRVSSS